jgi:hypothetical protein
MLNRIAFRLIAISDTPPGPGFQGSDRRRAGNKGV